MRGLLKFTLDLFDRPPAAAPEAEAAAPAPAPTVSPGSDRPEPLAGLLVPAQFTHPRANREVALEGARVAYAFRRARRRTIGFSVGPDGLVVSAPSWVPLAEIDSALRIKGAWILRKLGEAHEHQRRLACARIDWCDGATLPYLGGTLRLVLDPAQPRGGLLQHEACATPDGPAHRLQLGLPRQATPEQIRDAAQAWLMRDARRLFVERLDHFAPLLGVQWRQLRLSSARTRWGSASADGSIRLNWRLVHFRTTVIDYVVAHELSHLRVMDHSARFWDTVRSVVPDYAALRGELKTELLPPWA